MDFDFDYSLPHDTIIDDPLCKDINLSPPHEEALIQEGYLLMDDISIHDDESFSKTHSHYVDILVKEDDIIDPLPPFEIHSSDEALVENDINSLNSLPFSDDPMENQYLTSSPPRMSSFLPSCESICSVETTNMVYPKPLLTIKVCPCITIKGKPMESFNDQDCIAHTYHTRNNHQPNLVVSPSFSPSQPILPPPHLPSKEYNLIYQLQNTPTKISLWELLQTSPTYYEALKKALATLPTLPPNQENINNFLQCMHATPGHPNIVFTQKDLPSKEVQNKYDALMVVVSINKSIIRRTLIHNGSGLSVCSMYILKVINIDLSTIQPTNVPIRGFDNITKNTLDIITLPIKVGLVIMNTPIHVMPRPLNYNLLLGRPWLHEMHVVPSTLHCKVKFIHNNGIYTLHVDDAPNP